MQITPKTNRLSRVPQDDERMLDLRVWMIRNGITYASLGKSLGITGNGVQKLLQGERIPSVRHRELRNLGLPPHLLPPAQDVKCGPRPKGLPLSEVGA
jgi:hypothetical protein